MGRTPWEPILSNLILDLYNLEHLVQFYFKTRNLWDTKKLIFVVAETKNFEYGRVSVDDSKFIRRGSFSRDFIWADIIESKRGKQNTHEVTWPWPPSNGPNFVYENAWKPRTVYKEPYHPYEIRISTLIWEIWVLIVHSRWCTHVRNIKPEVNRM